MNLLRIYGATLIVALTMGMSACKNEESPATTPAASEVASSGQKISFDVEIEGLPSDEVRLLLQEHHILSLLIPFEFLQHFLLLRPYQLYFLDNLKK